ncbi:NHL repeat-containing protein [candidate division KSB1 bacterium]|nr:NHL repeat-containing protein [candidate division KSB1 bacterium]
MEQNKTSQELDRRNFIVRGGQRIAAFVLGLIGASLLPGQKQRALATSTPQTQPKRKVENPWEYDLESLKKIDPALITYEEIESIPAEQEKVTALALDDSGTLYIGGDKGVRVITDKTSKRWVQLPQAPACLAIDTNGDIFVGLKDMIVVYDKKGTKKTEFHSMGESSYLTSIAIGIDDVFVADAGNRVVWRMNKAGALLGQLGEKDERRHIPGLVIPSPYCDVALDQNGLLWVVNTGRHAFEQYKPDGTLVKRWEKTSVKIDGFSGCCNPTHMAILPDGAFVTAEKGLERIKIHETDGTFRTVVAAPSQFKEGTVGLDLAVNKQGRIFVLDPSQKTARVFEKK